MLKFYGIDESSACALYGLDKEAYKELSDLGGTFWAQSAWHRHVGQTGNFSVTLLGHNEGDHRQVWASNATSDRLSLTFTRSSWAVARVALGEQETHTVGEQDTLLHRETLLVVTSRDFEDVALEFIAETVTWHFRGHALVVKDATIDATVSHHGQTRTRT